MEKQNPMREIRIEKVTLNIGVGKDEDLLKRGIKLLEKLTGCTPVKAVTKKRIPNWGLRPGLVIGCKVTVRENPEILLKRLLMAKSNQLKQSNFDNTGNFSFGIHEYIDIEGMSYDSELKIIGLEVAVTLTRPGYRTKIRKLNSKAVGKAHQVTKAEAIDFMKKMGVGVE